MTSDSLEQERNEALLAWYRVEARDLPWRETKDPYKILVSEVMTQQTQVSRVAERYESFLEAFPTIEALAEAPLSAVITSWSGLGYNKRAERLHRVAKIIVADGWPTDAESLGRLPGVGPYTAAAIAVFAFGAQIPTIDTNVRRVLSRWHGEPLSDGALDVAATADLGPDAAQWNQAVMDLGAMLCRPRNPQCTVCPVESWCTGPDVYVPPVPQSRFEGSSRQIRGSIVRRLVRGNATFKDLLAETGATTTGLAQAVEVLSREGIIEQTNDEYRLRD